MRLHFLQHISFEGLGVIQDWALARGYKISATKLYNDEDLPMIKDVDWLVVLGGPMNIYQEEKYSWLRKEKEFIARAIKKGKKVLGICLGAQLIADALGAKVYTGNKEIGWFKLKKIGTKLEVLPDEFIGFHWHSDIFDIPNGYSRIAETLGCVNQGFVSDDGKVLGLQFHLEMKRDGVENLIKHCCDEIDDSKYVQMKNEILGFDSYIVDSNALMIELLDNMENKLRR